MLVLLYVRHVVCVLFSLCSLPTPNRSTPRLIHAVDFFIIPFGCVGLILVPLLGCIPRDDECIQRETPPPSFSSSHALSPHASPVPYLCLVLNYLYLPRRRYPQIYASEEKLLLDAKSVKVCRALRTIDR